MSSEASTHPSGGGTAEDGGGAVSILSSPPPHSQLLLALDEVLDRQEQHDKALRALQTGFIVAVCVLGAAVLVVAVRAFQ